MAIPIEQGWFLYGLMRAIRPRLVVEVGTHKGFSTMFLAGAVRDNGFGRVVSLDVQDWGQQARLAARGFGAPWVECVIQSEETYVPSQPVEMLFHDGAHGGEAIVASLAHWEPYLAKGAVVLIDDTRLDTTQAPVIVEWMRKTGCFGMPLPVPTGLWCIRYGTSEFEGPRTRLSSDLLDNYIG